MVINYKGLEAINMLSTDMMKQSMTQRIEKVVSILMEERPLAGKTVHSVLRSARVKMWHPC